jgi:hypothetical protein
VFIIYTVKCDGHPLLDFRDENLILFNPKVKVEVNTVGEGSFTIYKNHPYYEKIKRMKSIFEVRDEIGVIFRGRMTDDTVDFQNGKAIDLEGLMAFFNDSIIAPYNFPEDFLEDADYITASESGNVVEFFLKWLIDQHNSQVQDFQKFKLGVVTVSDPNNYLARSDTEAQSTWEILKSKLFDSALGGYLCIRYEADGNYIDYLSEFTLTNTQEIEFGENLLDLKHSTKGSETYSAIIPIGAEIEIEADVEPASEEETEDTETETETETKTTKVKLTLESIPDGNITDDIVKVTLSNGLHAIYSISAVEEYGWICPKPSETTWSDVTTVETLLSKSVEYLSGTAVMLSDTIEVTAVDLHFSNKEIQSFRIYRKVNAKSTPHGLSRVYPLTKLEIPLLEPQNTKITLGETVKTLTGQNSKSESDAIHRFESVEKDIEENRTEVTEAKDMTITQSTQAVNTSTEILFKALESYVETGNFEEFKSTLQSELEVWAGGISGRVTTTENDIKKVDGDLQEKFNTITKYFTFDINGMTIGQDDNPNKVVIDNDEITIFVDNIPIQTFKSDGSALIPILNITQSLNLLGLKFEEDETHINVDYIGGE